MRLLVVSGELLARIVGACLVGSALLCCTESDAPAPIRVQDAEIARVEAGAAESVLPHEDAAVPVDAGLDAATPPWTCDGPAAAVLLGIGRIPGGTPYRGAYFQQFFPMFYVTGNCTLYVVDDAWHDLRSKPLTALEIEQLTAALGVERWPELSTQYCNNTFDAPGTVYWYRGQKVVDGSCFGPALPNWLAASRPRIQSASNSLYQNATAVTGPLWFTLARSGVSDPDGAVFRNAKPWVWGEVSDWAEEDLKTDPPLHKAEGAFAEGLREIRNAWLRGEIGSTQAEFVPVLGRGGSQYELRLRAVTALDNATSAAQFD